MTRRLGDSATRRLLFGGTTSLILHKDLKKRGTSFVGSTIVYAFMQATGLVDDHIAG